MEYALAPSKFTILYTQPSYIVELRLLDLCEEGVLLSIVVLSSQRGGSEYCPAVLHPSYKLEYRLHLRLVKSENDIVVV